MSVDPGSAVLRKPKETPIQQAQQRIQADQQRREQELENLSIRLLRQRGRGLLSQGGTNITLG